MQAGRILVLAFIWFLEAFGAVSNQLLGNDHVNLVNLSHPALSNVRQDPAAQRFFPCDTTRPTTL